MVIDPNIKNKADDIRNKIYGKEVRESLASGLEAMSSDVVETVGRQDEVESQFQDVIENTTDKDVISAPEIITARNGEANLNTRLNKMEETDRQTTAQLAQTQTQLNLKSYKKYGEITLPEDFIHDLTFRLFRDIDGEIKHNYDIEHDKKDYTVLYIAERGNDNNSGREIDLPLQSIGKAIDVVENDSSITSAKLILLTNLSRNRSSTIRTLTKNYYIYGENETYIGGYEGSLDWAKQENGLYRAKVSSPVTVYDSKFKVEFGFPTKYDKVSNASECRLKVGSWYTDGTYVYINRIDDSQPSDDIFVSMTIQTFDLTFGTNCTLTMKNVTMINGTVNRAAMFQAEDTTKGKVVFDNVKAIKSGANGNGNGYQFHNLKSIWLFNCGSLDSNADGFNYHSYIDGNTFAFEYNCYAIDSGLNNETGSQNATTAHDGMRILRVKTIANRSKGPVLADVNGCYSIIIDSTMGQSTRENHVSKSSYYFDNAPSTHDDNPKAKVFIINSSGGTVDTFGINHGDSFEDTAINIDNFNGLNIPSHIKFNTINI